MDKDRCTKKRSKNETNTKTYIKKRIKDSMNELIELNYKKPTKFYLDGLLGQQVSFHWAFKNRIGVITRVYRDWEGKDRIKVEHEEGRVNVSVDYHLKEFINEIRTGRMKIL